MAWLKLLLAAPFAAVLIAFLFANREWVTIAFDPIGGHGLEPVRAPQYVALLVAAGVGVVAGSVATWLGQGRHRRAAREAEAEAARLRQAAMTRRA